MDNRFSEACTLWNQLQSLRSDVEKIRPEAALMPGMLGSGITAFIPHFNSLVERTKQFYSSDPQALKAIAGVELIKKMEERLAISYHQLAKQQILAGSGILLGALNGNVPSTVEESTPVTQTREFAFVTELSCPLGAPRSM